MEVGKKGEIQIAKANFVVIAGVKSVYALKTVVGGVFCGLVHILI